jgi:hypothetical protein
MKLDGMMGTRVSEAAQPSAASVLLVDDDPANLTALRGILEPLGVRLVAARSGDEALARVLAQDFAVILLDVRMPGMSGIETAALIKQRRRSREIPIIFLSAFDRDASYIARGYREGAVDYLVKPYEPEILRSKVAVFVDLYEKGERIKQQEALLRRQEREALTRASERRFRTLTDAMPLALWATGPSGAIAYANQRWSEYLGRDPDRGVPMWEIEPLHPDDRDRVMATWEEASRTQEPFELQYRMRKLGDGAYRWHLSRAVPEHDAKGGVTGWIVTAIDIDDQRRAEEALGSLLASEQHARREAEAASRLKDEFLTIVSHELRTPLTAILGWARVLRVEGRGVIDEGRALETIERNAVAQVRLIEDLLDVSRIITGKLHIEVQRVDVREIVLGAVDAIRPAAQAKGVAIEVDAGDEPAGCHGDAGRLLQVCSNLLTNAVKFTPKGGRVAVRLARTEDALTLEVRDTGQGISPSFLPHVFERFRQADTTSTRAHAGLGLGLALVRSLVELHGGAVRAESEGEGRGAVFTVTLPRAAAPREADRSALDAPAQAALHGLRVLVVDDEADARELVATVLEKRGAAVSVAASAADAFEALRSDPPDVLLSDLGMAGEDGYSLIGRVRALGADRGGAVPAVALTAYAGAEVGPRTRAAGFQTHLTKPVDPSRLAAIVADLARRPKAA